MWLLNCSNYRLESHNSTSRPEYWILSHTWDRDEVSFQAMQDPKTAALQRGFRKIEGMCKLAAAYGIQRVWIDTCCIDKTSSAELSESINSMFYWYGRAKRCVAFLSDLKASTTGEALATETDLRPCKWFTRGWTLQELLAPCEVEFYDRGWNPRGTRKALCRVLSCITNISSEILETNADEPKLQKIPVATRLSWAAKRKTTREEDKAYCLLGIFGVHMPLLYGERSRAFLRLQEAIAQKDNDMSLFAWVDRFPHGLPSPLNDWAGFSGLMAKDPSQFADCTGMERLDNPLLPPLSWAMTNAGFEVTTALDRPGDEDDRTEHTVLSRTTKGALQAASRPSTQESSYRLLLHCRAPDQHYDPSAVDPPVLAIWLRKTSVGFVRYRPTELCVVKRSAMRFEEPKLIRIATVLSTQQIFDTASTLLSRIGFIVVPNALRFSLNFQLRDVRLDCTYHPPHLWDSERLSGVGCMTVNALLSPQFGVAEINISSLPSREPFSCTCWLFCGLAPVMFGFTQEPWVELVCEEANGSVPLLGGQYRCHRSILTNPFALFGLFGTLKELGITPRTVPLSADCTARCTPAMSVRLRATEFEVTGGGEFRKAHQSSIIGEQLDHILPLPPLRAPHS